LVRRLLSSQFPDLAHLPLELLGAGWDNVIFRLGSDLLVRLPRRAAAAALVEHEQRWLPLLAPRLPLPIPVPIHAGRADAGFPWAWSVCPWFSGETAATCPPDDPHAAAEALGQFLRALHVAAPHDAPINPFRGVPLTERHDLLLTGLDNLGGLVNRASVLACWTELMATPPWQETPVWLHGDLHPANMLVDEARVSAVIDFGDLTAGDPATDIAIAWMLFPPEARPTFRAAMRSIDDDTWLRARAWALALGVAYLANSANAPMFSRLGERVVRAALDG
jgi:aminoglycoside phosphotransferase (APT) family kinase protein